MNVKWHAFFDFDKDFYKERTDLVEDWEKALKFGEMFRTFRSRGRRSVGRDRSETYIEET